MHETTRRPRMMMSLDRVWLVLLCRAMWPRLVNWLINNSLDKRVSDQPPSHVSSLRVNVVSIAILWSYYLVVVLIGPADDSTDTSE